MHDLLVLRSICTIVLAMLLTSKVDGSISGMCPTNCTCTAGGAHSEMLTVDCHGRVHGEQLSTQLDSLLSSNLTYGRLTGLAIVNSPLTRVPRSVCRLTTLLLLRLDNNRITRLPDNCLSNLTALTSLNASENRITELQDGLFDGLSKLRRLQLDYNRISSVGVRVFNSSSRLTSLTHVYLSDNRLTTLEPWLYLVGVNGHRSLKDAYVSIADNHISNFTNNMGLELRCGMEKVRLELKIEGNQVKHISDILNGWKLNFTTSICLFSQTLKLQLNANPLICDCVDFVFYAESFFSTKTGLLKDVFCNKPDSLFGRRVLTVPLDQFVCEVTERCPPGCQCVHRPANATLHVYCSNTSIAVLPPRLPELPKSYTKYKLDVSDNRLLGRLEHRDYFVNTSILDANNCGIETVDNWTDVFSIKDVYLDGNRLASLPRSIVTMNVSSEHLTLYSNPWRCFCDNRWMRTWISSVSNHLLNADYIACSSPSRLRAKSILQTSDTEFCWDPVKRSLTVGLPSGIGSLLVVLTVVFTVYCQRVKLFKKWKFHPFDRDECLGEDMEFDVFLSCNSHDNLPHGNDIREQLEQRGYRVCYPPRDFVAGDTVLDNICRAIVHSKRTVCLLTTHFLERLNQLWCC